ncbi:MULTISPECIES: leucine-rich repeat protein [unclassified Ruminococcus]|uniref:leucine-rich repeat protein n=1 Tax=unclassified Ruminococcus TaxID=2608920 RepID=UPI00210C1756|nr:MULTISPECIES: leucine-rich repeat protein [unclassified Ruminococcus]MCQ4021818.1 leucine-rich repeat protein [Ruminococcus sp. zg-924]MCQ4114263.1 leucine-rich repeat protein [Ruminococcus sp. zg-921]
MKRFKRSFAVLMAAAMVAGTLATSQLSVGAVSANNVYAGETASEQSDNQDGRYEYVILDDGTIMLTKYIYSLYSVTMEIPEKVDGYTVSGIGSYLFSASTDNKLIEGVVIPKTVNSISASAFYNCDNLSRYEVSAENPNYCSVDGILYNKSKDTLIKAPRAYKFPDEFIFPQECTTIDRAAFAECINLNSITIPSQVKNLGNEIFRSSSVSSVTVESGGVENISAGMFASCLNLDSVSLPDGITTIGNNAFEYSKLPSIKLPSTIKSIGSHAFYECDRITQLDIPDSVTTIGENIFYACSSLVSVTLGEGVTVIPNNAFNSCSSLNDVKMSDNVMSIASKAFSDCTSLKKLFIPKRVDAIATDSFQKSALSTVIGYKDTRAEYLANVVLGCDFVEVKLGDVTRDGSISISDAITVQKHIANIIPLSNGQIQDADIDKNGKVTISDAILIQKHIANISVIG